MRKKLFNGILTQIAFVIVALAFSACTKDITEPEPSGSDFTLSSIAVVDGLLLDEYKCETKVDGVENSIPLSWSNAPASANSFAITMVHYPNPDDSMNYNSYLVLWGIDKTVTEIPYGKADDGPWFMGPNKDLNRISYTSPCSQGSGSHEYTITIYALSETPASLPTQSSIEVTNEVLMNAISTVTVIEKTSLVFKSVNL